MNRSSARRMQPLLVRPLRAPISASVLSVLLSSRMEVIISPGNVTPAYYSTSRRVLAMLDPESGCDVWKPMEDEFSDRVVSIGHGLRGVSHHGAQGARENARRQIGQGRFSDQIGCRGIRPSCDLPRAFAEIHGECGLSLGGQARKLNVAAISL